MEDYGALRNIMVETQIIRRGVCDERVLHAMRKVPRHLFVPEHFRHNAYSDMALSIGENQTISQPYMVAVMTELLALKGDEKVLEIGTGSGYQTAVLCELAREVYTVERIGTLSEEAVKRLSAAGYSNFTAVVGDGTSGIGYAAPFDRILITAASPDIPDPLLVQLADGGIVVAPVGSRFSQILIKAHKQGSFIERALHTPCVFVPLIGEHGWKE